MQRLWKALSTLLLPAFIFVGVLANPLAAQTLFDVELPELDFPDHDSLIPNSWAFRAGGLFLSGDHLSDTLLMARGNFTPLLRSDAIDMGSGSGYEFEIEKRVCEEWSISGRYFEIGSFSDRLVASNLVNGAGVRYLNSVVGVLGNVTGSYDLAYDANLSSVDLMAKRRLCEWMSISAGARHLEFEDSIDVTVSGGGFSTRNRLGATNELTGFQLGSEVLLLRWNRVEFLAEGLAGVYHNECSNDLLTRTSVTRSTGFESNRTSFVGEMNFTGRVQLRKSIFLEGGYRLLWLDGIAMANEQAIINRPPLSGFPAAAIHNTSELFLHGATVNLVFQW